MTTGNDIHQRSKWERRRLGFILWRRRNLSPKVALMMIGSIIGILAGVGAWFLKWSIGGLARIFFSLTNPSGLNWWLFCLPFAGIVLTACYQRYILKYSVEHGVAQLNADLQAHHYKLRTGFAYQPIICNVMTVGLGGSAGAEGPIATVGATLGSMLARLVGMSPDQIRVLIGCGAGAGIAGIFKSPMGGTLFTLEVLKMKLDTISVLTLFVSALFGALTTYVLTGFTINIPMDTSVGFKVSLIGWAALLGVVCGFYSMYYNKVFNVMLRAYNNMKNPWTRNLLSATIVGICITLFPAMFGEGYASIGQILNGADDTILDRGPFAGFNGNALLMPMFIAVILMLKSIATVSSNSGGGVGGDFAPTIFAGAFVGLLFAWLMNLWFNAHLPVPVFALLGTAGAFSGIINAPLMGTFLVVEMVLPGYDFILPIALTAFTSFFTGKIFSVFDRDSGENKALSAKSAKNPV